MNKNILTLELNEIEVEALKCTIDSILTTIYAIDRNGYCLVECIDLDQDELSTLIKIAKRIYTKEELRFLCDRVDENIEITI